MTCLIDPAELSVIEMLPEDALVFDVGANVGDFTAAVLERRPYAHVYAFEAQPHARKLLDRRFGHNVTVLGALGSCDEWREFFCDGPGTTSQLGTLHPRSHMPEIRLHSLGEVWVDTIDSVCLAQGVDRIDLLKLDCEGHEYEVLQGARAMISSVELLYWEMIGGATSYRTAELKDFVDLLHERFDLRVMHADELTPLPSSETVDGMMLYAAMRRR